MQATHQPPCTPAVPGQPSALRSELPAGTPGRVELAEVASGAENEARTWAMQPPCGDLSAAPLGAAVSVWCRVGTPAPHGRRKGSDIPWGQDVDRPEEESAARRLGTIRALRSPAGPLDEAQHIAGGVSQFF